jgi:uncharacterized protein
MHLTVIAKEPRPGFVKTRMCPPCTPEQAAAVAAAALADTLDEIDAIVAAKSGGDSGVERVLLFDGDPEHWRRVGWRVVAQRGSGLAARLANGFDDLGPGLVVGMETPQALASVPDGLAALGRGNDALGLAVDGGYWAIGLHHVDAAVFAGIPMSTSATGIAQLRRLHHLGRSVHLLSCAHDLDTVDDLRIAAGVTNVGRRGEYRLATTAREVLRFFGES